ncbi:MAG: hypothetical protein EBU90_15935, partial [Proteobacteria bacterium]|nr:hypothetical protein [Pseudomonadota bacterium]
EQQKKKEHFLEIRKLTSGAKGKTWNLSEETKRKISEAKKGVPKSEKEKIRLSESRKGKNNPNYGKKHSEETKEKMRLAALNRKKGK